MAIVRLKGEPVATNGEAPAIGCALPDFTLTRADMVDMGPADFAGKVLILSFVPSLDTSVCSLSAKRFDKEAAALAGVRIIVVSRDLPFAQKRFCAAEGIDALVTLSELRNRDFGRAMGLELVEGPLAGLLARAVFVVGKDGKIAYRELVPEIGREPDYEAALKAARKALAAAARP